MHSPLAPGASLGKAALCPLHRIEAAQLGFHTPCLHPLPSRCFASRPLTHGRNIPLCNSNQCEPVQHAQQTKPVLQSHSLSSEPTPTSFFCLFVVCGASVTLDVWLNCAVPNQLMPCAPLAVSSPPWGGGTRSKKKNQVGRDACALPDPYEPSWCFNVSVKEHTHFFLGLVPTPLMPQKKRGGRKDYTRELQLLRRLFVGFGRACCYFLAVLYLLIEMDWGLLWVLLVGFLRSTFLCIT